MGDKKFSFLMCFSLVYRKLKNEVKDKKKLSIQIRLLHYRINSTNEKVKFKPVYASSWIWTQEP